MRTILSARPENRPSRGFPRIALVAAAVLTVPAFLVGPSAAGVSETTPTAATARSSTATATAPAGAAAPVSSPAATATARASSPTAPARAASPTPTPTPTASSTTAAGLTTEQTRTRSATITPAPRKPRSFCGGKLAFGTVNNCGLIIGQAQDSWTFTTTADSDVLYLQVVELSGVSLAIRVNHQDGWTACELSAYHEYLDQCRLGPAGAYTLTVGIKGGSGKGGYTLSAESRRTPSTCGQLPADAFSWASAGVSGTLSAGSAARCFTFDQPIGSKLFIAEPHERDRTGLRAEITDARHQQLCESHYAYFDCTLSSAGPYRIFIQHIDGKATAYNLRLPRISQAVGCPTLPLAPFGDPGAAVGRGRLEPYERACHSFTTTTATQVMVRISPSSLDWRLYDDAGRYICDQGSVEYCDLPAAGRYTLLPWSGSYSTARDYQVGVTPLHRVDGCGASTGTSWDQPTLQVRLTSPVQATCHPFQGRAGDRVVAYTGPVETIEWLVDQSGTRICTNWSPRDGGCVLPADGTYRMIWSPSRWVSDSLDPTYQVQIRRLTDAAGCPTLVPGSYDAAPVLTGIRCRAVEIAEAGDYRLRTVNATNNAVSSWMYDREGRTICLPDRCTFPTAGRYTLVFEPQGVVENHVEHAAALLPWAPSGCATVSDTGWRDASHRGAFQVAGQVNCLQLTSPAGSHIALSEPVESFYDRRTATRVVDATGAEVCDSPKGYSCELLGQAPFFALIDSVINKPTATYAMAFSRVDGPPACPALPRDVETAVTTGADRFVACFSIPADQHAAMESFTWKRIAGTGVADVSVFDSRGPWVCGRQGGLEAEATRTCSLLDAPVTVLFETDGKDATYRLTHRDASAPTT
ncbi:hypothetical protein KBX37_16260 [Micromonospora sp. U56]|uniref:hypothetical protein n=1 Tax=Micromonospora sp. U56 TaxID=2824900 RepID=UPI001B36DBC3|nr:hypothetical protein [Micromonospora sp. U56]MBQ0894632.1 hypothetical protein [Micromonospora sp. U56]